MSENLSLNEKMVLIFAEVKNPTKNAKNPFLKNSYADLSSVLEVVRPLLAKYGLLLNQYCGVSTPGVLDVYTEIRDGLGSVIVNKVSVVMKEMSPQGSMGAFTYGRRYGVFGMFGLVAEDDDGNAASGVVFVPFPEEEKKDVAQSAKALGSILKGRVK